MRTAFEILALLVELAISAGSGHPASAASFDCAAASSSRERLICSVPVLSHLDAKVGLLYQQRKALLSPPGMEQLQGSERSWLHYISTICPLSVPAEEVRKFWKRDPKTCLTGAYENRLKQLSMIGRKVGPFLFTRVDFYDAELAAPEDAESSWIKGYYSHHVAYPQVDSPLTREAEFWNKKSVQKLDAAAGTCDTDSDYSFEYSNGKMLSLEFDDDLYCPRQPHGIFAERASNIMLPAFRVADARDVFGSGAGWRHPLQILFAKAFANSGWEPGNASIGTKSGIFHDVAEPSRWSFSKEGLSKTFSAYDGGCYTCSPPGVTIPWRALKPLLAKDSVVP